MAAVVLAQSWTGALTSNELAIQFLNTHGKTLEYRHTGIDSDHRGLNGSRRFVSEPYAVCSSAHSGRSLFALTLADMKLLTHICQAMPDNIVNSPIKKNMGQVMNRAAKDYLIYREHIAADTATFTLAKVS